MSILLRMHELLNTYDMMVAGIETWREWIPWNCRTNWRMHIRLKLGSDWPRRADSG